MILWIVNFFKAFYKFTRWTAKMFQTPWRIALQRHDENVGATPLLENQTHSQIKGMSSNHFRLQTYQ